MLHSTFRVKLNERKRLKCGREKIEELIIIKKPKIRLGRRLTYYDRSRFKLKYLCKCKLIDNGVIQFQKKEAGQFLHVI